MTSHVFVLITAILNNVSTRFAQLIRTVIYIYIYIFFLLGGGRGAGGGGDMKILWIFLWGHLKIGLYLGVISMHLGSFHKVKFTEWGIFLGC